MEHKAQKALANGEQLFYSKMLWQSRIRTLCTLIMALSLMAALLYIGSFGARLNKISTQANELLLSMNEMMDGLDEADLPGLVEETRVLINNASEATKSATDSMDQAVGKLNRIDLDTLNKAIADLAAVVEPLAKLFGR